MAKVRYRNCGFLVGFKFQNIANNLFKEGERTVVYVISKYGKPLMPTKDFRKVRILLKAGAAKVIKRTPFTIQLTTNSKTYTQPITLGVDAGSQHIGLSASTEKKELYASEVDLRTDVSKNLAVRRECRRARRNRKTRYRQPRFNNRVHSKHEGWLAPSVENKIDTHIRVIENVRAILPITRINVEGAAFDSQKLLNPDISGEEYQQGDQLGFNNAREYVLFRDGHLCQCCKGKSGDKILTVHHIESRQTGGDAPNNLVTLCKTCHTGYHQGTVKLPETIKRGMPLRDAAFMGIMRWTLYNRLSEMYPGMVSMTYGYITKYTRISNHLPKTHTIDALCIAGHPTAERAEEIYYQKKVRCHNRQLHKMSISKGGKRKSNQAAFEVFGFRLFDKVRYKNQECFIFGRRTSGYFDLRLLDGTKVHAGVSYKQLTLVERAKNILIQKEVAAIPPMTEVTGLLAE